MIRFSNRTQAKPTTEMIVSITDQVLMVCPTVIPKYSLTSQNPASLTCEKNSECGHRAPRTRLRGSICVLSDAGQNGRPARR
jgi:hypothetical protein